MVVLKITSVGLNAALNAQSNGVVLKLDKIKFGSGQYNVENNDPIIAMMNPFASTQFVGGDVEPQSHTLRFNCSFKDTQTRDVYEIGLFTESGVLFAVASTLGEPFFTTSKSLVTVFVGGMKLSAFNSSIIEIVLDENGALALQLFAAHEGHPDPHPQYVFKSHFEAFKAQNTLEHNNILTLITATAQAASVSVEEAIAFLTSMINQHKNGINPHPQYLLASTMGIDLKMNANLNTPVDDAHRAFGWNGQDGDGNMVDASIRWWNSFDQTATFRPWRAYGKFLLNLYFQPQGDGEVWVTTFKSNGDLIESVKVREIHDTHQWHDDTKYVFELPQGGYAEIRYWMNVWNRSYGVVRGSIYVDDRVKPFFPVGYSSLVNAAGFQDSTHTTQDSDYSVFPNFEWFYYRNSVKQYLQLESNTTLENPVFRSPHFYRKDSTGLSNVDVYVIVEVGFLSIETPSDYIRSSIDYSQGAIDSSGTLVVGIPFNMRGIAIPAGKKAVYTIAYYMAETIKDSTERAMPIGSIDGDHQIYVDTGAGTGII